MSARHHTIRVTEPLSAGDIELAEFCADITVDCVPETGDGVVTFREPAHYELVRVTQVSGPFIPAAKLADWAGNWICDCERTIRRDIASRPAEAV